MDKLKIKIEAVFVLMVLLVSTLVVPVSAAKDNNTKSNGFWCDTYTGGICDEGAFPEGFVELTGAEKNKAIAQANKDDDVKALKKEIKADGYTPLGNGEIAGTINVNGTEVLMVSFFFKPKNGNGNETAEITYLYNTETGDTTVIRTAGCFWEIIECAASMLITLGNLGACVGVCSGTAGVLCIPCLIGLVGTQIATVAICERAACCQDPNWIGCNL